MDFKELTNKKEADLQNMLAQKRNDLREMRFKAHSGQLKQVRDMRSVRKEIAQILTALNALGR